MRSTRIYRGTISTQVGSNEFHRATQSVLERYAWLPSDRCASQGGVGDKAVYFALGRAFAFLVSLNADRPSSHSTDQLHQGSNAGFAAGADIQWFSDGRWGRCRHNESVDCVCHVIQITRWSEV